MDRLWQNVKDVTRSVTVVKTLKNLIALIVIVLITGAYGMSKALQTNKIELTKTRLIINQMADNKYEFIKKTIKDDEGFKMLPYTLKYDDATGKHIIEKFQTGGYGHKIKKGETHAHFSYTKAYWEGIFEKDFETALKGARNIISEETIDPVAFGILVEMVYQMGEDGVKGFKTAIKHLKNNDYNSASDQLLYNYDDKGEMIGWTNWHKQTPDRANNASDRLSLLKMNSNI